MKQLYGSSLHFPLSTKLFQLRSTLIFILFFIQMIKIIQCSPVGKNEKSPPKIKSPRSEIVPFDHWHCGSNVFDRSLSHQLAREKCPKRMFEADLCCIVHDACYMDELKNRQICDEQFCHCLERTVGRSQTLKGNKTEEFNENSCLAVSTSFCEIVNLLGGIAYASSLELVKKQKEAMLLWEKQEEERKKKEKELIKNNEMKKIKNEKIGNKESSKNKDGSKDQSISVHKFPLKDCSDKNLVECSIQLQQCTDNLQNKKLIETSKEANGNSFALILSAKLAECTNQFCKCSSNKLINKNQKKEDNECINNLASICAQFNDDFGGILNKNEKKEKPTYLSLWSVNLNHQNDKNINIGLTIMCTLLGLLVVTLFLYILTKIIKLLKSRFYKIEKSKRKDYLRAKRRNTLTNVLRHVGGVGDVNYEDDVLEGIRRGNCGQHYISLNNQKKPSTVSSPTESVATSQQLLISCHKKTNSENLKNNETNKTTNYLLTNLNSTNLNSSSQAKLIEEETINTSNANSSSTLSDISSG